MNDSKLEEIYNEYIVSGNINTTKLLSMGLLENEIDMLLKKRILLNVNDNLVVNSKNLLAYCKDKLLKDTDNFYRIKCYQAVLNSSPLNKIALFQLFIEYVIIANYDEAYYYLDLLFSVSEEPYLNDCNYYLYLMSIIHRVPKKYQTLRNYVWDMNVSDTLYNYEVPYNKKYVDAINNIRKASFRENYTYAFSLYNDLTKNSYLFGRDYISKILLYDVIDVYKNERDLINNTILNDRTLDCLNYLHKIEQKHPLSIRLNSIKDLLLLIYEMILTNKNVDYEIKNYNGKNVFSAILTGNIEMAYTINSNYITKMNIKNDVHDKLLKYFMHLNYELQNFGCINYSNEEIQPLIKDAIIYKLNTLGFNTDEEFSNTLPNINSYEQLNNILDRIINNTNDVTRKLVKHEN